ncbi:MAG: phage tail tape measure protein, partial [Deltaproteobacteria bacterium]|nr:phage tail tape measure protein [Deltaproteobacteria bacterium]
MAQEFEIKINIEAALDGENGLDAVIEKLNALREAVRLTREAAGDGELLTPEGSGEGEERAVNERKLALARELERRITEIRREGVRERAALEEGTEAEESLDDLVDAREKAEREMTESAREGVDRRVGIAQSGGTREAEFTMQSLEGLDAALKRTAENGRIGFIDMTSALGPLKTALTGVLSSLAAYASFQGIKSLASGIISTGAEFEATMLKVRAVSGATAEQYERMNALAVKMGAETEFSTSQAAQALQYLAMAGLDAEKAMQALPGTMNLASAGALELGTAADITTNILAGMGMEVEDLGRVNDVMVTAFTSSNATLEELGEAFKYVGPAAKGLGYDIETVSVLLGNLANAGIKGSMAGTSLQGAFFDTAKVFEAFGESATDAGGKTKDFLDALDLMVQKGAGASQVQDIFGDRATKAVLALMDLVKKDAGALREEIRKVEQESAGAAEQVAETLRGSLKVVMDELGGAFESVALGAFGDNLESLKEGVRGLTESVRKAAPMFKNFASSLLSAASTVLKVLDGLVQLATWLDRNSVLSFGLTAGFTAFAGVIGLALVKSMAGFIVTMGRSAAATAELTAMIKAGSVSAAQAEVAQRKLNLAYQAGLVTKGAYAAMTRQLTALQAAEAGTAGTAAAAITGVGVAAAGASRGMLLLKGAFAAIGGPVGVALLAIAGIAGAVSAWRDSVRETREELERQNKTLRESTTELIKYYAEMKKLEDLQKSGVDVTREMNELRDRARKSDALPPELKVKPDTDSEDYRKVGEERLKELREEIEKEAESNAKNLKELQQAYETYTEFEEGNRTFFRNMDLDLPGADYGFPDIGAKISEKIFGSLRTSNQKKQEAEKERLRDWVADLVIEYSENLQELVKTGARTVEQAQHEMDSYARNIETRFVGLDLNLRDILDRIKFTGIQDGLDATAGKAKDAAKSIADTLNATLDPALLNTMRLAGELSGQTVFDVAKLRQDAEAANAEL